MGDEKTKSEKKRQVYFSSDSFPLSFLSHRMCKRRWQVDSAAKGGQTPPSSHCGTTWNERSTSWGTDKAHFASPASNAWNGAKLPSVRHCIVAAVFCMVECKRGTKYTRSVVVLVRRTDARTDGRKSSSSSKQPEISRGGK